MRTIVSEVLLNKELYKSLTEKTGEHYDGKLEIESSKYSFNFGIRTSRVVS